MFQLFSSPMRLEYYNIKIHFKKKKEYYNIKKFTFCINLNIII
jgi:hypothetical protein